MPSGLHIPKIYKRKKINIMKMRRSGGVLRRGSREEGLT